VATETQEKKTPPPGKSVVKPLSGSRPLPSPAKIKNTSLACDGVTKADGF